MDAFNLHKLTLQCLKTGEGDVVIKNKSKGCNAFLPIAEILSYNISDVTLIDAQVGHHNRLKRTPAKVGFNNLKMIYQKNLRIRDNAFWKNGMGLATVLAYHSENS